MYDTYSIALFYCKLYFVVCTNSFLIIKKISKLRYAIINVCIYMFIYANLVFIYLVVLLLGLIMLLFIYMCIFNSEFVSVCKLEKKLKP